MPRPPAASVHLRVSLGEALFGPGKADLLQAIAARGSIAAAGRDLGMSYALAWRLVAAMNADFRGGLVAAARGGAQGGGARLTPAGARVLAAYRRMQARAEAAVREELPALRRALNARAARAKAPRR